MIKSAADFIMGVWTAPEVPLLIEYPLDIMEELRALLCDELQRLSRGSADAAGVLFGVSRGSAIRIMTFRTISRGAAEEHSTRMSRHDRAEMVRVLGMAASDPAMQGYEPLGWFVSHAENGTGITPSDIDLFEHFFPNSWQVTLLLRRGPGGTARAGFFVREPDGSLRQDASYRELFIQPVRRVPGASGPRSPWSAVPSREEAPQRPVLVPQNGALAEGHVAAPPSGPVAVPPSEPVAAPPSEPVAAPPSELVAAPPSGPVAAPPSEPAPSAIEEPRPPEVATVPGPVVPDPLPIAEVVAPVEPSPPDPISVSEPPLPAIERRPDEREPEEPISAPAPLPVPKLESFKPPNPARVVSFMDRPPATLEPGVMPAAEPPLPPIERLPEEREREEPISAPAPRPVPKLAPFEPPKPSRSVLSIDHPPAAVARAVIPADETPSFTLQTHSFGGAKWLWVGLGLVALAAVIYLFMQKSISPTEATFGLRVASLGDQIEISWDRDSTPVWNGQRASLKIQDGPDTKQVSLSSDQLRAGKTTYARETPDVAIEMTVYDSGRDFHEFARFIAPAPYSPNNAQSSHDANDIRAERDNLANQVQKLKEDVRKEAARADQAEGLVRILENRLRIDDSRGRSQSKK